jgi:hypothetical protein
MNLFGKKDNNKGAEEAPKKVVSEKTKKSASFMSRSLSKLNKLFASKKTAEESSMSNSGYLGEIYMLIIESKQDAKLEQDEQQNFREEEDSEEQKRHTEIIKALTLRRKPKRVIKREKKAEVTAKKKEEPAKATGKPPEVKPSGKPADVKPAGKPPEVKPSGKPADVKPAGKPAEVKPTVTKPVKTAKPVKPVEPVKPPTATQKPPATPKPSVTTATKIATGIGVATTTALIGKEALADNIAKYESKGSSGKSFGENEYNAYNKGTSGNKIVGADKPIDFSKMSIQDYFNRAAKTKQFPQGNPNLKPGDPETLFAVGRYQIIPPTMLNLVKKLKIDPNTTKLNPTTQDRLFAEGLTTSVGGRSAVDNYINGKPGATRDDAIMALAKEFASVGVPYDTQRYDEKRGEVTIKKGQSYYSGMGGNKAHNSPEEVGAALDADRAKKLKLAPVQPNISGPKIDQTSKENKDMKVQDQPAPMTENNNTTNIHTTNSSPTAKTVDDRPAHQRK